ncbi:alkaline phosphatase [Streptomyces bohaiensis]|uniref:alkaline phosphatase n=1 Tax=Streptomyces bohaiensis TaxID=1431344 RepID=UPI003B7F3F69
MHISRPTHVTGPGRAGAVTAAIALAMALIAATGGDHEEAAAAAGPRNVIVLIGDGMGYAQIDAASLYRDGTTFGQVTVEPGAEQVERSPAQASTVYQNFPVAASVATYPRGGGYDPRAVWDSFPAVTEGFTDSAAAATALATGERTDNGRLGTDTRGDALPNLTEHAAAQGRATGVVTSVPFSHATPAGFVVHRDDRGDYHAIAHEMIHDSDIDVVMGAGDPARDADGRPLPEPDHTYLAAEDHAALLAGETPFTLVNSRDGFRDLATATETPRRVLGLAPVAATLQYERSGPDRTADGKPVAGALPYAAPANEEVPTLPEMAEAALNVLGNASEEGLFLMVEGGAIDWAGHANDLNRLIEEQTAFDDTVAAVTQWVERESSWDETLVVVTADHETGYLNGEGADPGWRPLTGEKGGLPAVSWHSTDHTGSLVPLYARGAGAERLAAAATGSDPVRGAYLDNVDIPRTVLSLWGRD